MTQTKPATLINPDATPADRIRTLFALSLCVDSVRDDDLLTIYSSLDLVEAIVVCEQTFGIPEIDDDLLLKCKSIGGLIKLCHVPAA